LRSNGGEMSNEKVFALTSLLFDGDVEVFSASDGSSMQIVTRTSKLFVPKLNLKEMEYPESHKKIVEELLDGKFILSREEHYNEIKENEEFYVSFFKGFVRSRTSNH
jgi:hypothetical protein